MFSSSVILKCQDSEEACLDVLRFTLQNNTSRVSDLAVKWDLVICLSNQISGYCDNLIRMSTI